MFGWLYNIVYGEKDRQISQLTQSLLKEEGDFNQLFLDFEELERKYNLLKEPDTSEKPEWMDESRHYNPNILVFEKGTSYWVEIDAKDIYAPSVSLEKLVEDKGWVDLPLNTKLRVIWEHVIKHISYRYDQSESWEYPPTTHFRKKGDCEDGTIYFVTLCRIARVPGDRVFNALGKMGSIGHSWPIVKMEDDKWYIMETTIDSVPTHPLLLRGSTYKASYGVQNWKFNGVIKNGKDKDYQI